MQKNKCLKIYVAGPYTTDDVTQIDLNVRRTIDIGLVLWKKGHFPYIPHLTHFVDLRAKETGVKMKWEDYIEWDRVWLELCDALLFTGSSKGADIELEYAKKLRKTIYYDVKSIPSASRERNESYIHANSNNTDDSE
jgi:hypothetical protein